MTGAESSAAPRTSASPPSQQATYELDGDHFGLAKQSRSPAASVTQGRNHLAEADLCGVRAATRLSLADSPPRGKGGLSRDPSGLQCGRVFSMVDTHSADTAHARHRGELRIALEASRRSGSPPGPSHTQAQHGGRSTEGGVAAASTAPRIAPPGLTVLRPPRTTQCFAPSFGRPCPQRGTGGHPRGWRRVAAIRPAPGPSTQPPDVDRPRAS